MASACRLHLGPTIHASRAMMPAKCGWSRKPRHRRDTGREDRPLVPLARWMPQGCGRRRPAPSGAPLPRPARSSPGDGSQRRDSQRARAMRTRMRTALRGIGGAVAVMFRLARAVPDLLSDRHSLMPGLGGPVAAEPEVHLSGAATAVGASSLRPPLILKQHRTFRGRLAVLPADGRIVRSAAAGDGLAWWG